MISKEELAEVKNRKKSNLYYEEKEYLQYIFLNAISKFSQSFIFKGGTCLRICYGLERASEDLDFNTNLSERELKLVIAGCLKDFSLLNIEYEIYSEREYEGNLRIEARFKGPLYSGNSNSTNTLKLNFNKNKVEHKTAKVVQKIFSDVPPFTLLTMDQKEILVEKIRALINRKQARDLYDAWMLIQNKTQIDKSLLIKKLKEEKLALHDIKKINFVSKEEYEIDLKDLVAFLPPYEQVKNEIENFLSQL
jgi:predicted nucleotidyltransferase component of viral defense system